MMDNETKQLLEEIKTSLSERKNPFFHSILQSVIVALIVAIPTAISIGNRVENRILKIEIKQLETSRELKARERKMDYNFGIIRGKYPELYFIQITEPEE